ncbi:MAG: ribosomal RNA small subunit methyltransferase A [Dehalococcoidia bacterium]|nr:ribosomal RNA small subunit methyltransferase A [Dehalococcoidia bacterium]
MLSVSGDHLCWWYTHPTPHLRRGGPSTNAEAKPSASSLNVGDRLRELGLHARKGLAQHFLVSAGILQRILHAADLQPDDYVVEVGPGLGVLTDSLIERVRQVVAAELDEELAKALQARYAGKSNVRVLYADARQVPLDELVGPEQPYKVVANLPYYAANPIVRRFLEALHPPTLLVVMVQREVAQRMTAQPPNMTVLSIGTQVYARGKIVASVPPGAFRPPPEVMSAVVRLEPYAAPLVKAEDVEGFFALIHAGFSTPRKQLQGTLVHALKKSPGEVSALLLEAGIEPKRRAETVTIPEWQRLYEVLCAHGS